MDEEIARLQLPEGIDRRFSEARQPMPWDFQSEPDDDATLDRPVRQGRSQLTQPYRAARHEDWIDGLKLQRTARSMGPAKFVRSLSIATPEWPLFVSRFRALVHNVVPDDAQHIAILAERF